MSECIERENALDCFHAWVDKRGDVHEPDEMPEYRAIEALPFADVRPVVRGLWLQGNMPTYGGYKCSVCGGNTVHYKANFCPNCGADMRPNKSNESNALNALEKEES